MWIVAAPLACCNETRPCRGFIAAENMDRPLWGFPSGNVVESPRGCTLLGVSHVEILPTPGSSTTRIRVVTVWVRADDSRVVREEYRTTLQNPVIPPSCGNPNDPCCAPSSTCAPGLRCCADGRCHALGLVGESCCAGCAPGLTCRDGVCALPPGQEPPPDVEPPPGNGDEEKGSVVPWAIGLAAVGVLVGAMVAFSGKPK